jgi:hypothetical protein
MGQVCDSIKPPDLLVFALNTFNHFFSFILNYLLPDNSLDPSADGCGADSKTFDYLGVSQTYYRVEHAGFAQLRTRLTLC